MTNYNRINKYHTIFLFLFSLSFLILKIDLQVKNITLVCFFLIATIGVSHGSLDNFKGAKLLKILNIKNKLIFYFIYIFVALAVVSTWLIFPFFMLAVFLIFAAYHFGKEDSVFGKINLIDYEHYVRHKSKKVVFEDHVILGYNYRMTDIQASIGIKQLEKLDWIVEERRKIAHSYNESFKDVNCIRIPIEEEVLYSLINFIFFPCPE